MSVINYVCLKSEYRHSGEEVTNRGLRSGV